VPGWPVLAATGHYRNGILLAPWTAREIVRLLPAMASDHVEEAGPFSPARFLRQETPDRLSRGVASV
jgi:glycine/D-amino acid oxidase-like deaminating enzyme